MRDRDIRGIVSTYPELGDVADMDHLRGVVQETAQASQPHQILFVFQLETQNCVSKQFL